MGHTLIEPTEKTVDKEIRWDTWRASCDYVASRMPEGPMRDRLLRHDFVDLSEHPMQSHLDRFSEDTHFGRLHDLRVSLHRFKFRFECGGVIYDFFIDFADIENHFPEDVLKRRQEECVDCGSEKVHLRLVTNGGFFLHNHFMCRRCFKTIQKSSENYTGKSWNSIRDWFRL